MIPINDLLDVSMSAGTLRHQDLLLACMNTLEFLDQDTWISYLYEANAGGFRGDWEQFFAEHWLIADELFTQVEQELVALAPDGYAWGAHPDDGSSFGFWKVEEAEDEDILPEGGRDV